jgi:hypothetical protein
MVAKLKRLCLETLTWRFVKITQKLENHLEQDINVIQQKIKQVQDIGLVKCGKDELWQLKKAFLKRRKNN